MRIDCMMIGATMIGASLGAACGVTPAVEGDAAWTLDHATPDGAMLGVWGSSPTDVWAVGGQVDRSLVLHSDGTSWTPIDVSSRSLLYNVYGFSASDVYAVGEAGLILHYDGTTWQRIESGTTVPLFGLWGASGEDVWIVGGDRSGPVGSAVVLRGTRGSFHRVALPEALAPNVLFKVHGVASDDLMIVGSGGTVLRSNGTEWHRDPVPTAEPLFSTWGRDGDDVYAVGGTGLGEILHFDGQQWTQLELPIGQGLTGVFTSPDGPTIAVGPQSILELGRDGSLVQAKLPAMETGPFLHGVWGDGAGTTYAVGGDLPVYPNPMTGEILTRR
jgi:hypothetical protein